MSDKKDLFNTQSIGDTKGRNKTFNSFKILATNRRQVIVDGNLRFATLSNTVPEICSISLTFTLSCLSYLVGPQDSSCVASSFVSTSV